MIGGKQNHCLVILVIVLLSVVPGLHREAFGFNYVMHRQYVPYTPPPQPAKGECFTDPDFHTTTCRVSDVVADGIGNYMAIPVYSRWTPLSSGRDYLYLQRAVGNPDALLYNPSDYSLIKIMPRLITIDGVPDQVFISMEAAEIRWDYTGAHPHRFYYVQGCSFYKYDVRTDSAHLIHDFTAEFPTCGLVHNDVEGDSSSDSRYWAFMIRGEYNGTTFPMIAIITYDKATDRILGVMDVDDYHAWGGQYDTLPRPNMVDMSPLGNKIVLLMNRAWSDGHGGGERPLDIGGYFDGAHAWDLDFTHPVKVGVDATHTGWGWDLQGNELFVSQNNRTDWIQAVNIKTGALTRILYHGDFGWNNGWHFARMPQHIPGWVLMSTYSTEYEYWGQNQLLMLELKAAEENPRVWRLGHTHNEFTGAYFEEAFATISQYGDKIWWAAKWPGQENIETYEMTLPENWWDDLNEDNPTTVLPSNQWQMLSLPQDPGSMNRLVDIFADDIEGEYGTTWLVYRFDPATNRYVQLDALSVVPQGEGFWIIQFTGRSVTVDMPETSTATPVDYPQGCLSESGCFTLPVSTVSGSVQWNMLGYPFPTATALDSYRVVTAAATPVSDCSAGDGCTLNQANTAHVLHNVFWHYVDATTGYRAIREGDSLHAWNAFWTAALVEAPEGTDLIVPSP